MRVKGHFTRSLGTPDWVVEHLGGIRIYGEDKLAISRLPTQKRFQPQINIRHADRKRGGGGAPHLETQALCMGYSITQVHPLLLGAVSLPVG